jgi:hypothetical protein
MLRTASSLPLAGLLTLGFDPARFQTEPPACYRASWQLPGPDFHRQATTSLRTRRNTMAYVTVSPPALLGARINRANAYLAMFLTPSTARNGAISCIVPMVSHTDHTEHDVHVRLSTTARILTTGPGCTTT